jgi:hypothetical protein
MRCKDKIYVQYVLGGLAIYMLIIIFIRENL